MYQMFREQNQEHTNHIHIYFMTHRNNK